METLFNDPSYRLNLIKLALNAIKEYQEKKGISSICYALATVLNKKEWSYFAGNGALELFPEIYKHKPLKLYSAFWFVNNDYQSRIDILEKAIDELNSIIKSNVFNDPLFRLKMVKAAQEQLKIRQNNGKQIASICCALTVTLSRDDYGFFLYNKQLELFPEIFKQRPTHIGPFAAFWFPTSDYTSRFAVLEIAERELLELLNNRTDGIQTT